MAKGMTRRAALRAMAAPALLGLTTTARADTRTLKISHQFPGSGPDGGDFRDRLCRKFAEGVEKRTDGALKFEIYPNSSLMKTFAQFDALKKGALDLSLYPTTYSGGEIPELNVTFMPGVVTGYEQAHRWKTAPIGKELTTILESKGVKLITWMWQSGGIAARGKPVVKPADVKGLKIRGGSREMDMMFKGAGATTSNMPSNEIYISMQTGAIDVAVTSSTSLISFKLEELSKGLTSAGGRSFFFVLEPILMSKTIFDMLPPDQQKAITEVGQEIEPFGLEGSKADDQRLADVYTKAGAQVVEMDAAALDEWKAVARDTAWKDFAARSTNTAKVLKMAEEV
jgi:TRAP-type C4-dicarboxylate transport system substrate-binding protein